MSKTNQTVILFMSVFILFMFNFCRDNYTPKPSGYIRIDFPEKKYSIYDSFPSFRFEYPVYAEIATDTALPSKQGWLNMNFPSLNGTVFLSYKKLNNDLDSYINDCRKMVYKHTIKAESIDESIINDAGSGVYGLFYDLKGNVASSVQFYVTDSTKHFLRGSLYFNSQPNQDSLAPLVNFVRKDIEHLLETLEWK